MESCQSSIQDIFFDRNPHWVTANLGPLCNKTFLHMWVPFGDVDYPLVLDSWGSRGDLHLVFEQNRWLTPSLKGKALEQLQDNYMDIEKMRLLTCESTYCIAINAIKLSNLSFSCDFQLTQLKGKMLSCTIPGRPLESDILSINNKYNLCIVDYHTMFPVIKQVKGSILITNKNMNYYFCRICTA